MDPVDAGVLYAAVGDVFGSTENGVYKSIDGGESWSALANGLPTGIGRISIAVAPSLPQRLYALLTNPSDAFGGGATIRGIYRSDDGGASWTPTNPGGTLQATYGWYLSTILVDPTLPDRFFAGGVSLIRSTNGGDSYVSVTPPHVDLHAMAYDAANRLVVGDDGGIHRTTNAGGSWIHRNNGLGWIQFYPGLSVHPTNDLFLIGGTQDNGSNWRETATSSWFQVLGGDGGFTALHPDNPATVFAEFQGSGNLFRSTNGGPFFDSGLGIDVADRHCFVPPIVYSPANTQQLLYGTHRVYRSTNNGATWVPISGDLTGGPPAAIRCLAIAPSNDQIVYAAANDGRVLVSENGGVNWTLRLTGVPGWPRVTRQLAVDPMDDATAYLSVGWFGTDRIRKTTDRGVTWSSLNGDLPDIPANAVAVRRVATGSFLFLGTDAGAYVSSGENRWSRLGEGMPNSPISDVIVDAPHDRLIVATLGRGAWSLPLPGTSDADADGDLDMIDFDSWQSCYSGSREADGFVPPDAACLQTFDVDRDGDVDSFETNGFVSRLTGPGV
jgi:photosystem II stability/assembly factor-like uncharacterized protein